MEILGLINIPEWLLITGIITTVLYIYLTWNYGYWEAQNVPTIKPIPIFGSVLSSLKESMPISDIKNMKQFGKVYGLYEVRNRYLMIYDLEMIKTILVKDFNYFADRRYLPLGGKSRITRQFLTNLRGDEWKSARNVLTPTFTSGKLRQMSGLMEECARKMVKSFHEDVKKQNGIINVKDRFGVFTMDVIGSCCFSYNLNSQDPNDPFIQHAKMLFDRNFAVLMLILMLFPKLIEILEISVIHAKSLTYFEKIVNEVVKMRRKDNIRRSDFLQLLLDAQDEETKGENLEKNGNQPVNTKVNQDENPMAWKKNKILNESGLVANSILFLLAGYETTANSIGFVMYLLALNPDCQSKLLKEIDETIQEHGKLTPEIVMAMPYLDKVISETLRILPPAIRLERTCVRDYQLGDILIPKGAIVAAGVYGIHHDPEIYPNPEVFDPERFSPENKAQRHSMAYLPFGVGPRVCIGNRFALMETKIAVTNFFREFRVSPCSKTEIPIKWRKGMPMLMPLNGLTLKVEAR